MQPEVLPWHQDQWSSIAKAFTSQHIPHALLLHGPGGVGKTDFAQLLARTLVCGQPRIEANTVSACRQCRPCQQYASDDDAHADILQLQPLEGDWDIKIDQARAAIDFANQTAHYGGRKVILIHCVDVLNRSAANAMLKTLEEPPNGTILILVSESPGRLLPTVRSRCQQIRFSLPPRHLAEGWLQQKSSGNVSHLLSEANGAPLRALQIALDSHEEWRAERDHELLRLLTDGRSPSRLAQHWLQFEIQSLCHWLYDRLRVAQWLGQGVDTVKQGSSNLQELCSCLSFPLSNEISKQLYLLLDSDNTRLNKQLAMESLLMLILESYNERRST